MLFLTVLLFGIYLVMLINGGLFKNSLIQTGESKIKFENKEITKKEFEEQNIKSMALVIVSGLSITLLQLIYLILAISHKEIALVSVAYFILYILWMFVSFKKSNNKLDLTKEEDINKYRKQLYRGRSLKGLVWQLLSLSYFGYVAYLLLF